MRSTSQRALVRSSLQRTDGCACDVEVFLAIDHRDESLFAFVPGSRGDGAWVRSARRSLINLALRTAASAAGVIARAEELAVLHREGVSELILGLSDDVDPDSAELSDALELAATLNVMRVKSGFTISEMDRARVLLRFEAVLEAVAATGMAVIAEPYFESCSEGPFVEEVLDYLGSRAGVSCVKLDRSSAKILPTPYPLKWYLRSGQTAFLSYVEHLKAAASAGCSGAMVGAAVWSDLLAEDEQHAAEVLAERLDRLAVVVDADLS